MDKIAIIGYGRFGRLLADILKPYGQVHVLTEKNLEDDGLKRIAKEDLKDMDWVIPAVPISALSDILLQIKDDLKPGSLLMDVCSVKVKPCEWLRECAPENVSLLGSHPMFGPDSAKDGIDGLQVVLVPLRISEDILNKVKNILHKV